MKDINCLILSSPELKKNWLNGFISQILPGASYKKFYGQHIFCLESGKRVILTEDETLEETNNWVNDLDSNCFIITSNHYFFQKLLNLGFETIFFPYRMWFYMLIPLRKLGILSIDKSIKNDKTIFNFLNRRWSPGRYYLLDFIFRIHSDLLHYGTVTANKFTYYQDHPLLYKDRDFLAFYKNHDTFGENITIKNGLSVSSNLENLFYIAENIPGVISIQVETFTPDDFYKSCYTEKSMTALATQQIPIIIGPQPGLIARLENQGFDVFRDVVNQEYDKEKDYNRRLELAINNNVEILSGKKSIPNLDDRLKSNQQYLFSSWTNKELTRLQINLLNFVQNVKSPIRIDTKN